MILFINPTDSLFKKLNIDYLAHMIMVIGAGNTAANETDKINTLIEIGKQIIKKQIHNKYISGGKP